MVAAAVAVVALAGVVVVAAVAAAVVEANQWVRSREVHIVVTVVVAGIA